MISLRPARPEDEAAVFLLAHAFATSFPVERAAFSAVFAQVLEAKSMYLAVALAESEVAGYALGSAHPAFFAGGPVAWLEEIMVREDCRRQGIGKRLVENFERWAVLKGCRQVALATRRAADFYQNLGYLESAVYFRKVLHE